MTKKELHDSEEGNYGMVYLYHDGKFWNAYERSAYILCTQVRPLKPTKRAIKSAGGIHLVSVGFPVGSEASNLKGIPQGTTVTKITVCGENLSAAVINLSGNALTLNAAENGRKSTLPRLPSAGCP